MNSAEPRPLRRRDHLRADPDIEKKFRGARRRAGRGSCTAARPAAGRRWRADLLSRRVQRLLGRLSRPDRLPRLHRRRHLRGQERVFPGGHSGSERRARAHADWLGHVSATLEEMNRRELVLGTKSRSGQQWDIWEAVYSPVGRRRLSEADLGQADGRDRSRGGGVLARALRSRRTSCSATGTRASGAKLEGKIHIYVGDMDNYYLNNAVYLVEDVPRRRPTTRPMAARSTTATAPSTAGTATTRGPTPISRLRYHQMFAPKIVERILKSAPARRGPHELALLITIRLYTNWSRAHGSKARLSQ